MRVNTNVSALIANNQMGRNVNAQSKSMEKLSSGVRIKRAADDAAGLAISEKMRAQIKRPSRKKRSRWYICCTNSRRCIRRNW